MGSAKNNNKGGHPWLPLSPDLARSRVALEPSRLSAGTAVSSTASWALELPFPHLAAWARASKVSAWSAPYADLYTSAASLKYWRALAILLVSFITRAMLYFVLATYTWLLPSAGIVISRSFWYISSAFSYCPRLSYTFPMLLYVVATLTWLLPKFCTKMSSTCSNSSKALSNFPCACSTLAMFPLVLATDTCLLPSAAM
mmetsp:Transcript_52112/g.136158  ORF Transcript_52112/g.136158 Transcript_52112/m.136158 type:complete len:200 (+) Transcript_52112:131-730(+)